MECAIDHIAELLRQGKTVSDERLQREYPHLMPNLTGVVRELQTIISAELEVSNEEACDDENLESDAMARILDEALPGYNIQEVIHSGGQGTVFKAFQQSVQRNVAIKVMHDSPLTNVRRARRFSREIQLVSQLQLPNIVQIYESGVAEKHPYFIMEFVEGVPLDDYALANQLSARSRVEILLKIVRAVSKAHQRGVIHRDLKPSNILVDVEGEPHILDFGLAKALSSATELNGHENVSLVGHVIGTLPYLSPEQASGFDEVDVRSDVYALGIILFELLTGVFPFDVHGDKADARAQIIRGNLKKLKDCVSTGEWTGFPSAAELDDDLQSIVSMALAKATSERYQSAAALADDLARYLSGDIVQARSDQRLYMAKRILRKYWMQLASAAAVFVSLIVATLISTSLWFEAKRERDSARKIATLAEDTLDHVVTEVDEQIESLAGGKELRISLLDGVTDQLEKLNALVKEDKALGDIAVSLRERQADIARSEGRRKEAEELYLDSATELAQLESVDAAVSRARLYRKAGTCLEDGKDYLDLAIKLARSAADNRAPGAEMELVHSLLAAANNEFLNGRHISAAAHIDESLELLRNRDDQKQILAEALERNGDVKIKLGELARSSESFRESIRIREELLSARPFDVRIRYAHMIVSMKLGSALAMAEHFDEALVHARAAFADSEYLIQVDGNNSDYCRAFMSSAMRLAMIYRQQKNYVEALAAVSAAVEQAQSMVEDGNNDFEIRRQLGFVILERGRIHRLSGEYASAVDDAQTALATRLALADEQPDNLDYLHEVAAAHDLLGLCLQRVDRHAEAQEYLIASCTIHEELIDKQPEVPDRKLNLAQSRINLATWHMRLRTTEGNQDAIALLESTRTKLENLRDETPGIVENKGFETCLQAIRSNLELLERETAESP